MSLALLIKTMNNIYKIWGSKPELDKKNIKSRIQLINMTSYLSFHVNKDINKKIKNIYKIFYKLK